MPTEKAIGIDLGADAIYAVALSSAGEVSAAVVEGRAFLAGDLSALVEFCRGASQVAIDAPDRLSRGPHVGDDSLSPKFRTGRCSDVATSRQGGGPAVPWVTPMDGMTVPGWMSTGFDVWRALRSDGHEPMEVFPAGCFHRMNGSRWPAKKTTLLGRLERLQLLRLYVRLPSEIELWTHDGIDATVAALVAHQGRDRATAVDHCCPDPDGSRLWYPSLVDPTPNN